MSIINDFFKIAKVTFVEPSEVARQKAYEEDQKRREEEKVYLEVRFPRPLEKESLAFTEQYQFGLCPYCQIKNEPIPQNNKKCPSCSKKIYVLKNKLNNQPMMLTEKYYLSLTDERKNRTNQLFVREIYMNFGISDQDFDKMMTENKSQGLSANDLLWKILNEKGLANLVANEISSYRSVKLSMYELLKREQKEELALNHLLEIVYIDLKNPKDGFVAPGIYNRINDILKKLLLTDDELKKRFLSVNMAAGLIKDETKLQKSWIKVIETLKKSS